MINLPQPSCRMGVCGGTHHGDAACPGCDAARLRGALL